MGAVRPGALLAVTALALLAAALALAAGAWRGGVPLPAVPLWPLAGFLGLALLQLAPLPGAAHALLAPGSHAVWHPAAPDRGGGARRGLAARLRRSRHDAAGVRPHRQGSRSSPSSRPRPSPGGRTRAWSAGVVAAAGFLLSAYAIFARARFGALLYGSIPVPTISPFGPFVSKNHFAGWAAMAAAPRGRPRPRPRRHRSRPQA